MIAYLLHVAQQRFKPKIYQAFHETAVMNRDAQTVAQELNMSVAAAVPCGVMKLLIP